MDKIRLSKIFGDHFKTLHYDKGGISYSDIILFYAFPLLVGLLVSGQLGVQFLIDSSEELITFYSVLGGFMLNLLALIYGFDVEKFKNPNLAKEVLTETTSNVSYLIAIASLLVILLFVMKAASGISSNLLVSHHVLIDLTQRVTITFFVFSFINFCLTLLMVLKRFYSLNSNRK